MENLKNPSELNTKIEQELLVLMDFSEASYLALKYAMTMAKIMKTRVQVLHVSNPGEIIDSENQAVALNALSSETRKTEDRLKAIIEIISEEGIEASYFHSIGNIINEFQKHIKNTNPELVIIGKKKVKPMLSGKLTNFLLNKFAGSLLIIGKDHEFMEDSKITIGCKSNTLQNHNSNIVLELNKCTSQAITLVNVIMNGENNSTESLPQTWQSSLSRMPEINLVSQKATGIANGLVEYISENNIELLCIGRGTKSSFMQNLIFGRNSTVSKIARKVQIPLLLMGYNSN